MIATSPQPQNHPPRRLLRLPEVIAIAGFGRASIYSKMQMGEFPKCVKIGPRAVAWDSNDIDAWVSSKLDAEKK